jgi:hypothetical protein
MIGLDKKKKSKTGKQQKKIEKIQIQNLKKKNSKSNLSSLSKLRAENQEGWGWAAPRTNNIGAKTPSTEKNQKN